MEIDYEAHFNLQFKNNFHAYHTFCSLSGHAFPVQDFPAAVSQQPRLSEISPPAGTIKRRSKQIVHTENTLATTIRYNFTPFYQSALWTSGRHCQWPPAPVDQKEISSRKKQSPEKACINVFRALSHGHNNNSPPPPYPPSESDDRAGKNACTHNATALWRHPRPS